MDWVSLLSDRRLQGSGASFTHESRNPFETDGDRIAFSMEWRRASGKTQVHEPDMAGLPVRTRGTHSLEVSRVGRSLGQNVAGTILARHNLLDTVSLDALPSIISSAGLAHDLGNPPFGHAGEWAIAGFFSRNQELLSKIPGRLRAEFANIDGNAQGFRILTKTAGWRKTGGLQLTSATLATMAKYPFSAEYCPKPWGKRKYGFYGSESNLFAEMAANVGLEEISPLRWCRHPLVHLLEAADDLCYSVVDTVDAALVGDLSHIEAIELLMPLLPDGESSYQHLTDPMSRLEYLQSKAIGRLVNDSSEAFLDQEQSILQGTFPGDILMSLPVASQLELIGRVANEKIYNSPNRKIREECGDEVIATLLTALCEAHMERERTGRPIPSGQAGDVLRLVYDGQELHKLGDNRYQWVRSVIDRVMSMTDAQATRIATAIDPDLRNRLELKISNSRPVSCQPLSQF
ncbi:dGTP triphosphohydrolase [Thalassospira xianhensis]|uniref:dGTP triphosphohydrolase n=1 Tax=Thalassospira xianhensis TaxID=478503 RepID=UPI0011BE8C5B|nr:dNTP triphosphohydrolase [Thalassospira xianhensis]